MAIRKFAMIADSDVFGIITLDDDPNINSNGPRISAGLSSNPKIVEISSDSNIDHHGWTWNGTDFIGPVE